MYWKPYQTEIHTTLLSTLYWNTYCTEEHCTETHTILKYILHSNIQCTETHTTEIHTILLSTLYSNIHTILKYTLYWNMHSTEMVHKCYRFFFFCGQRLGEHCSVIYCSQPCRVCGTVWFRQETSTHSWPQSRSDTHVAISHPAGGLPTRTVCQSWISFYSPFKGPSEDF